MADWCTTEDLRHEINYMLQKLGLVLRKSQPRTHEAYEEHDVKIYILDVFPFSYLQASLVGGCTSSSSGTQPRTTARP